MQVHRRSIAPPIAINISDEPDEESPDLSLDPASVPQQPEATPESNIPPVNAPPFRTCHRTSVSIGLEAPLSPPQISCAQSIRDKWPSGATVTCLPSPDRTPTRHARDGQLVREYLHRTLGDS